MNKQNLKEEMYVILRDGSKCIIISICGNYFVFDIVNSTWFDVNDYANNLTTLDRNLYKLDIVEVYKDYTLKNLLWKRKEPKLTDDEKVILRNISKEFKYIARDEKGWLFIYNKKPWKLLSMWDLNEADSRSSMNAFLHLFQFIEWEDEEPYLIQELLAL